MRHALLLAVVCGSAVSFAAQPPGPGSGVPFDLAVRRAASISDLAYDLSLSIPASVSAPITGTATVDFQLKDPSAPLVFDFETSREHVKSVMANQSPAAFQYVNGHIVVPSSALRKGRNTVQIEFRAGNDSLNRNADFLYALFVPARARLAIPCFDQPDLKARWTLTLRHPAQWQAVSNGATESETTVGQERQVKFAQTKPLSTYLFSFVVGDFKVESAERNGRTFRMFHRETDAGKVARNRDAIFDLHAAALAYMERYTGIPYPFGKLDFVLVPAFQFGGMEHAGKILYNASGLLLDESATQNQLLGRASVISHETAHMWFGDLVTMRWFDDVWMKEVFANFMAAKIVNPSFPAVNHELRFLLAHYPAAYDVDRTPGANPIRQPLENLDEAGSLYGSIIYQKAPIVMRHLERLLGEESFRDGLREYLRAHEYDNASWLDLIEVLDPRTPADLAAWSRSWVELSGRPEISADLSVANGRVTRLAFRQRDPLNRRAVWPQQLRVAIGGASSITTLSTTLDGPIAEVKDARGLPTPRFVLPNGEGWAYGDIELDAMSLAYLMRSLPDVSDPLVRGSAWVTLWDALLDRRTAAEPFFDLVQASLPRETDEQLTQRILSYAADVWWRFLSASARTARAPVFERLLRHGLGRATTASQKAAWFGALRTVALTPDTVAWLRNVWAKSEAIPGLPLAEADYSTLALELAVREVEGWPNLLALQLARIDNPDRKSRFQFVMPALSANAADRDRWFKSLADPENRRHEPWVLEGLTYLHHPLRARASAGYVAPSLEMLWEIQKTGDIFFPKRWLDSTLGGYSSPEVANMVRSFLASLPPAYPPRLRNITLQSADVLFRAAGQ
jgi:aminopeptidase N